MIQRQGANLSTVRQHRRRRAFAVLNEERAGQVAPAALLHSFEAAATGEKEASKDSKTGRGTGDKAKDGTGQDTEWEPGREKSSSVTEGSSLGLMVGCLDGGEGKGGKGKAGSIGGRLPRGRIKACDDLSPRGDVEQGVALATPVTWHCRCGCCGR